jgi:hypothetical protein
MVALCIKDCYAANYWNFVKGKYYEGTIYTSYESSVLNLIDEDKRPVRMDGRSMLAESFKILECSQCEDRKCNSCPIDKEKL